MLRSVTARSDAAYTMCQKVCQDERTGLEFRCALGKGHGLTRGSLTGPQHLGLPTKPQLLELVEERDA